MDKQSVKTGEVRGELGTPLAITRRTLIGGMGGALAACLATPKFVMADHGNNERASDPFIVLLTGVYVSVSSNQGPADNLGLISVNLNDGSYAKVPIYPIFGIDGTHTQDHAIGTFYVQFAGNLCAYDVPGGAIAMQFLDVPPGAPPGYNAFAAHDDGAGGFYLEATWELTILEATGVYRAFQGGHNHMVDRLHQLPNNAGFHEFCFCNISQYQFP